MATKSLIIGLTGGLASGKSTVLNYFRQLGIDAFSADSIVHKLMASNGLAYAGILNYFGTSILNEKKEIERAKLRQLIFQDSNAKLWLEKLLHPLVRQRLLEEAEQATSSYVVVEIPLLTESKASYPWINRILVVDADEKTQQQRAEQRSGLTETQSRTIIDQQASRQARSLIADDILYNQGDLLQLELGVKQLHNKYKNLAIALAN